MVSLPGEQRLPLRIGFLGNCAVLHSPVQEICRRVLDSESGSPRPRVIWCRAIIRVRLGDIVPAEARLLDGDPVEVDQSALTGESASRRETLGKHSKSGRRGGWLKILCSMSDPT